MTMDSHYKAFMSGWFDPLDKRLKYMAALDDAIKRGSVTVKITTISMFDEHDDD